MTYDLKDNKKAILQYLKDKIKERIRQHKLHQVYINSYNVGVDLGISTKTVGALLYKLSKEPIEETELNITKYADSGKRITWLIVSA